MNLGYIFDLSEILSEEDLRIPYLTGLFYNRIDVKELSESKIIETRDNVTRNVKKVVDKHQFFYIMKNDQETLKAVSNCINDIQKNQQHFNSNDYEIHIVCNFIEESGFSIQDYEKGMPCLKNNRICVYSWFLDKYDFNAGSPISDKRRAHAISRMISLVCSHSEISSTLQQMTQGTKEPMPIYKLFGDACVFFDEEKRTKAVRDYYNFKSIQHLLNIPDVALADYMKTNVLPYANEKEELDKRIDATGEAFLKENRVSIEASEITEKTQGLLIKSSADDEDYLVSASNNKLVFIDELAQQGGWQLEGMENFLSDYQAKVGMGNEIQETVSEDFLDKLYYERYYTHEREGFDRINNRVSENRKLHIKMFKQKVDKQLNDFLNKDSKYSFLQNPLTKQETAQHHTNIGYGIAFLEYLESGKGDFLVDHEVSMGDISFTKIKEALEKEESKRSQEYKDKKTEIEEKYLPQEEGKPSKIKAEVGEIDNRIKLCREEKRRCDYQVDHWVDEDAEKLLTARTKSVIAFACGVLCGLLWLYLSSIQIIANLMNSLFEHYDRFRWEVFTLFTLIGLIIGAVILYRAICRRREAEETLEEARQSKRLFMNDCVQEMNIVTEKHYNYLLAYHGLKTMRELVDYVAWKREDLLYFRKTLFNLMLQYWLSVENNKKLAFDDDNTFELTDSDAESILFGSEGNRKNIPYCFADGALVLSQAFDEFKRKKARYETTRDGFNYTSRDFNQAELEKEIIPCMEEHENVGLEYSALNETSILPADTSGVEMDDIHQGHCGDCYFMATLAAIARNNPEYIIGKNGMVEELGEEHKFFRVKFYNKDGKRVSVDIDNRFWNKNDEPYYAKKGILTSDNQEGSYDPWVMAVEKAWAKINGNGYDGIVGAREDGKEYERKVEYSFAVTGKTAFYCMTNNVPDQGKLCDMMKKHFLTDHLPITLYSVSDAEAQFADQNLVHNHAYAVRSVNEDGTFDIFNPWNSHMADEDIEGKHYEKVDISFIKNNFSVVVFFGIKEADFDFFERNLTQNAAEDEVTKAVEKILNDSFTDLNLQMRKFEDLLTSEEMNKVFVHSNYLFSKNRIQDPRGKEGGERDLVFLEGKESADCLAATEKMKDFLQNSGPYDLQPQLNRDDNKQMLTIFRLSPHYVLENFY